MIPHFKDKLMSPQERISSSICPVCYGQDYRVAYRGPIRDGVFGRVTETPINIVECIGCGLRKLDEFILGDVEYSSGEYRQKFNDTSEDTKLLEMHDPEQAERLKIIGMHRLRGQTILDYGCGHGSFLDAASGIAEQTYGIEPFKGMWDSLRRRGHQTFASGVDALFDMRGKVDIVTCFGVIEHVVDPVALLTDSYSLLAPGGTLYLQTDNLRDILMVTEAKEFPQFFYRSAHNWYFLPENIDRLAKSVGFDNVAVTTTHGFDFSNFLRWHREGKPTGLGMTSLFGEIFESVWRTSVEAKGCGDLITLVAHKHGS
jgi:2-polyprenyl-3-methyl-5-hydroxy-6-metoxy-1,4-benzoquinol methylase